MLRKTNYTIDVQPIFNPKRYSRMFKHEASEKDFIAESFLRGVCCGIFEGFFLKFHLECSFPMLKWVFLRVSRDLSRHPGTPQKKRCFRVVPSNIPNRGFWCHEMGMPVRSMEHCPELPPGRVWSGRGAGWRGELWAPAFLVYLLLGL